MKFHETPFCHELVAIVAGTILALACFTFVAIPLSLTPDTAIVHLT